MSAILRESANEFRVRFREIRAGGLRRLLGKQFFQVDPLLIAQTIMQVMRQASMRSASGNMLLWNDYRVIMHPAEFEPLRALQSRIQGDLVKVLSDEVKRLKGELVGDICVHLIADEGNDLPPGEGIVRTAFATNQQLVTEAPGEMTVRITSAVIAGEITSVLAGGPLPQPHASSTVVVDDNQTVSVDDRQPLPWTMWWPGGTAQIPGGQRTVVGREHAAPPAHFVALHGAASKINKQQLWLLVGPESITVGRFPRANPVVVNGAAIEPGNYMHHPGPQIQIDLSHGVIELRLARSSG